MNCWAVHCCGCQQRPNRGKTLLLRLTPQGRRLLDAATGTVRGIERAALRSRSAGEQRVIKQWLSDLARDE